MPLYLINILLSIFGIFPTVTRLFRIFGVSSRKSGDLDAQSLAGIRRTRHVRRAHVCPHDLEDEALEGSVKLVFAWDTDCL